MSNTSIFTKPWFVLAIIVVCFAILTPKIFIPLFKQAFGLTKPTNVPFNDFNEGSAPRMEQMRRPTNSRPIPQQQHQHQQPQQSTSKSSMLTFVVPMYAVGILVYLIYVLFKTYIKKKDCSNLNADEKEFLKQVTSIKWNPNSKEFSPLHATNAENDNTNDASKSDIDNFIFKMKSNLNQINNSLIQAEKKGDILDDSDIQSLKLQLTNTELQMEHIYKLLDSISKQQQKQEESNQESAIKKRQRGNKSVSKKNKPHKRKSKIAASSSSSIKSSLESSDSSDDYRNSEREEELINKVKYD